MKFELIVSAAIATVAVNFAHAEGGHHEEHHVPECEAPIKACQAAGYVVGAHKKGDKEGADKGLWVDCIDAVADGKATVAGVDTTAAKACKAAKGTMKGQHKK